MAYPISTGNRPTHQNHGRDQSSPSQELLAVSIEAQSQLAAFEMPFGSLHGFRDGLAAGHIQLVPVIGGRR